MVVNWQKTDSPSEQPKSPDLHRGAYIHLPATSREHKGAVLHFLTQNIHQRLIRSCIALLIFFYFAVKQRKLRLLVNHNQLKIQCSFYCCSEVVSKTNLYHNRRHDPCSTNKYLLSS